MPLELDAESAPFDLHSVPKESLAGSPPDVANQPTDLHEASTRGDTRSVQYLLVTGADASRLGADGWRPLHLAAARGHQEVVELLLSAGARPDHLSRHPGGFGGAAALHVAVAAGQRSVVEMLLRAGADPQVRDDAGFTPLHIAASLGARDLVKTLVLAGANAATLVADTSALELALRGGHRATAALLRQIVRSRRC